MRGRGRFLALRAVCRTQLCQSDVLSQGTACRPWRIFWKILHSLCKTRFFFLESLSTLGLRSPREEGAPVGHTCAPVPAIPGVGGNTAAGTFLTEAPALRGAQLVLGASPPRRLALSCRWPCPRPFSPPPGCDWRWDGSARPRPVCSLGLWVLASQADWWFSWLATGPSLVSRHHTQNRKESPELCPRPRLRVGLVLMDTHLPDMGLWSISVRNF